MIRKTAKDYPGIIRDAAPEVLEAGSAMVQADAKHLAPVDTGTLRSSIVREVKGNIAIVGTNVEYAPYVEYGTKRSRAQPFLRPAIDRNRRRIIRMMAEKIRQAGRG